MEDKEKLSRMQGRPLNENCSAVILNKLPKKLGDPGRFLIPCEFTGITTCNALADLGASINLMPYSVWKDLALPELTPTCMTLELADRSITEPIVISLNGRSNSFLALEDDPTISEVNQPYQDPEGDILILEAILNSEPPPPLPNHEQYMPGVRKELKLCEAKTVESSLMNLRASHRLKLSDIKGVSPEFCTHKILMEEDYEPSVQSQRRVNPKIHDVIKKEVEKLLDAGLIYPISDSPWVSPVHCVPKKGGMTVITNDENELIPTRLVTGWRVCIDYRKLNEAT
ncbi:reverse transcriptase domain-containing protein [Tanacetum coccineum]|uniref:Reverse transcriptase domain-containing protein n=1 Tax=Tanacetum coccineum TaxID=301880 RepID=A0ABQ5EXK8_9ASTR